MDARPVVAGPRTPAPEGLALDQRFSLDVQGAEALRRKAQHAPHDALRQASRQFEALFMGMMLKSMRDATPGEGLLSSSQEKTYTAMLDQQLAQHLSGRGLGLAEALYVQLSRTLGPRQGADAGGAASPATGPGAAGAIAQGGAGAVPRAPVGRPSQADLSLYETATGQASLSRSVLPQSHVEQFVERLMPAVRRASEASGVPAQLIMAQAALESGWGRREIRGEDGRATFNLFGIKADRGWQGPVVQVATTEFVEGVARKTRAAFRAYASYEEAFADYARFLTRHPRYDAVRRAPDAQQAAIGLQRAGYATDPAYGDKLIRIMRQL